MIRARPEKEVRMVSLAAEQWMAEGRAEAEAATLRDSIVGFLEARFGPLDPAIHQRLRQLPPEALRPLVRAAATISSPSELFTRGS